MWFQWRASCSVTGVSRGRTALWNAAIARPSSISSLLQEVEEACARRGLLRRQPCGGLLSQEGSEANRIEDGQCDGSRPLEIHAHLQTRHGTGACKHHLPTALELACTICQQRWKLCTQLAAVAQIIPPSNACSLFCSSGHVTDIAPDHRWEASYQTQGTPEAWDALSLIVAVLPSSSHARRRPQTASDHHTARKPGG